MFLDLTLIPILVSTTTYFLSFFYWSVNCKSLVYKLYITFQIRPDTQTFFYLLVLSKTCIERLISTICYFSYSDVTRYCSFWVCKLQIFLTCAGTEVIFMFEEFYYCHLLKVQFQLSLRVSSIVIYRNFNSNYSIVFSFLSSSPKIFQVWSINYKS